MSLSDPLLNEYFTQKLKTASIIGHTEPSFARIWIRVYQTGTWTLAWSTERFEGELKTLEGLKVNDFLDKHGIPASQRINHNFSDSENLTHTFDLNGLQPDTPYYYVLMSDDTSLRSRTEIGYDEPRWFRTMATDMPNFNFGFYSCHDPYNANGDIGAWKHFLDRLDRSNARFVIGGGDQVYVDSQNSGDIYDIWEWLRDNKEDLRKTFKDNDRGLHQYLCNLYRMYYLVYWRYRDVQAVYRRYPQYMIWDDHEIMDGWGSRTKEERLDMLARRFQKSDKEFDQKLIDHMWHAARIAYFEYVHSRNPGVKPEDYAKLGNGRECIWDYAFQQGETPFYVLDMRGHHNCVNESGDNPADARLLGTQQFQRFSQWLQHNSEAKTLFVVLPVPLVHWNKTATTIAGHLKSAKDDVMDEWEDPSNHLERDKLLGLIFPLLEAHGQTLVFLSGDVHTASIFKLTHNNFPGACIFQVTSSAISRKPAPAAAELALACSGYMSEGSAIHQQKIYAKTGAKNFAIIHLKNNKVMVDVHWPEGEQGEFGTKTVVLE